MSSQIDKQAIVKLIDSQLSPAKKIYPYLSRINNVKNWKRDCRKVGPEGRITRIFHCEWDSTQYPIKAIVVHEMPSNGEEVITSINVTYSNGKVIASSNHTPIKKKRKRSIQKVQAGLDRFNFGDE